MLDGLFALARSDSGVIAEEPHDLAVAAAWPSFGRSSAHGGTVTAAPNADGGLSVTITLPAGDALPALTEPSDQIPIHSGRTNDLCA